MFILYLSGYLLTLTYGKTSGAAPHIITIIHFTLSLASPVASVTRAALVSVNLFSLLCDGTTPVTSSSMGQIIRFGGPIVYLIVYSFVLLGILVWVDSGSLLPRRVRSVKKQAPEDHESSRPAPQDVLEEVNAALESQDLLRVLSVSKTYNGNKVVDGVSLGVSQDTAVIQSSPKGAAVSRTIGTTESLSAGYATYEVHFSCRTRDEVLKAQTLMAKIPGSRMADDVATRFEVPIEEGGITLAQLFTLLSTEGDFSEYMVEKALLESVFLKVIRGNNVREEDNILVHGKRSWKRLWLR
ncbi:hypothetical protein DXG03_002845 [Asterophora parasitica]|uniref:Uncharacterized protein n=1 Tax=Asterophora parasitica TaxID=117018 RepID=A0A9P7G8E2_9AGAR|nr:hypothetical protein DXG03_002845 [Asterophora parasitica]